MPVPKFLYKYRAGTERDLAALAAGKIYFSSPTNFNDPFDCALEIAGSELSDEGVEIACKTLVDTGLIDPRVLAATSPGLKKQHVTRGLLGAIKRGRDVMNGVCCFAEKPDDLLMWGHYANCHKGFCLEFETAKENLFRATHKVKYSDKFPLLNLDRIARSEFSQVMELVLTKAKKWGYEKEWRVLHNEANLAYSLNRACVSRVYFGAQMSEDSRQMICAMLQGTDTKFSIMRRDPSGFKLLSDHVDWEPIVYKSANAASSKRKKRK